MRFGKVQGSGRQANRSRAARRRASFASTSIPSSRSSDAVSGRCGPGPAPAAVPRRVVERQVGQVGPQLRVAASFTHLIGWRTHSPVSSSGVGAVRAGGRPRRHRCRDWSDPLGRAGTSRLSTQPLGLRMRRGRERAAGLGLARSPVAYLGEDPPVHSHARHRGLSAGPAQSEPVPDGDLHPRHPWRNRVEVGLEAHQGLRAACPLEPPPRPGTAAWAGAGVARHRRARQPLTPFRLRWPSERRACRRRAGAAAR